MVWRYFTRKTVSGVEARAGFLDRPVLAVLLVSITLVVVAFAVTALTLW